MEKKPRSINKLYFVGIGVGVLIIILVIVGAFFIPMILPQQNVVPEKPDIRGVTIEETNPDWLMDTDGLTIFLKIRIYNPTDYRVYMKIYGTATFFMFVPEGSRFNAGTYTYDKTENFAIEAHSKETFTLKLYEEPGFHYTPPSEHISALSFTSYHIDELERYT